MALIPSPATEKDDGWLVLHQTTADAAVPGLKPPKKNSDNKALSVKQEKQEKHQSRLQVAYMLLHLGTAAISCTMAACSKPILCCRSLKVRSGAVIAQTNAWISNQRTACVSRVSWRATSAILKHSVFHTAVAIMITAVVIGLFANARSNVVLNLPRPAACTGPYKQLSVDISAFYNSHWDKVAGLDRSLLVNPIPASTRSVHYLQEAEAVASSINTITSHIDAPLQVPLQIDFGQVLLGSQVGFHVNMKCQAGPLTLSRRDYYYLPGDGQWSWRIPALDPVR